MNFAANNALRRLLGATLVIVSFCIFFPAQAQTSAGLLPYKVHDIRVEGLQRLPVERVYAALPIQPGDTIDREDVSEAVKRLFATGNYENVQLGRDGDDLVVVVAERPSIARIELDGNKSIQEEDLRKGLTQAGLAEGEVFQRSTLESISGELERQYIAQGRYGADIETEVVPLPRNRVELKINIYEGKAARISDINIVGNSLFSDEELLEDFELSPSHFWSFIKGDDKYSRQRLGGDLDTTNQPGATPEALRAALHAGCILVQPSWIQLGPWTSPDERGFGMAPHFVQGVTASYGLWVDTRTGKRFVNELADRKTRADAILAAGNRTIAFADAKGYGKGTMDTSKQRLGRMKRSGALMEYGSLEEMARAHDIPVGELKATVKAFNESVDAGKDSEFGRYMAANVDKIDTPPYYVMRLSPKIHHTMGGCAINTRAQALDVLSNAPITGLYVVGEASGGVHGASRLGSCAYTDCLTFGRIAGRNAAAQERWG